MIVIVGLRWHRRLWGEGWEGVDGTDQPWVTVTRDWNGDTWGGWLAPEICRRPGGIRIQSYVSPEAAMAAVDRAVERCCARWGQREIGRALAERGQRAAVDREREARGTRGPGARLRR